MHDYFVSHVETKDTPLAGLQLDASQLDEMLQHLAAAKARAGPARRLGSVWEVVGCSEGALGSSSSFLDHSTTNANWESCD